MCWPASTLIEDTAIWPVHGQNQGLEASDTFSVLYMTEKVDPKRETRYRIASLLVNNKPLLCRSGSEKSIRLRLGCDGR